MSGQRNTKRQILVFAIAAAFLTAGLLRGEASDVLQKAMRICLECIGIG